jgi:hypothetical protein
LGIELLVAEGASQSAVKRAQNTRLAVTRSSLMILWVAVDMAHQGGGFKVNCAHWFRSGKNSAWNEGLGRAGRLRLRCFSTGKSCRKFSQNADFAHYLDCLPPKHTFF